MCVCVRACACVCERRVKICHKMCTDKKKKAYVHEGMQRKQKKENHIQGNNRKKVMGAGQTKKKRGKYSKAADQTKKKKRKRGTKGREMKNVMEMKMDKNLNKRRRGDRKGSRVNGINTHGFMQQSGFVARSKIKFQHLISSTVLVLLKLIFPGCHLR